MGVCILEGGAEIWGLYAYDWCLFCLCVFVWMSENGVCVLGGICVSVDGWCIL